MKRPSAKKSLGQHFLKDEHIAQRIAEEFQKNNPVKAFLEIGPGTGVLTKYFVKNKSVRFFAIEKDIRMIVHLRDQFPQLNDALIQGDILSYDFTLLPVAEFSIVGNFPYNISSQILFKVLDNKSVIPFAMGMFQKEVADRVTACHGNKKYGILSVLIQAYYNTVLHFDVNRDSFSPPPKVQSAVISLLRKEIGPDIHNTKFFNEVVKAGFNQRRKTLHNSLAGITGSNNLPPQVASKRAEQLSVEESIQLSNNLK